MKKNNQIVILALIVPFLFSSCGLFRKKTGYRGSVPRNVVILPVANQTRDLSAPVLVRYFLHRELKSKGFDISSTASEVDQILRQMGISEGSQIESSNMQYVGQLAKADGIIHCVLLEFRPDISKEITLIRAKFQFVETQTGKTIWERNVEVEGREAAKVPVRGTVTTDWPPSLVRSIAKSPAGKLPKRLVKEALKSIPKK